MGREGAAAHKTSAVNLGEKLSAELYTVADTSEAGLFLARASFVTGTTLDVDGGYSHGR